MDGNLKITKSMKQSVLIFAMIIISFSLQAQTEKTYTEAFDSVFINSINLKTY